MKKIVLRKLVMLTAVAFTFFSSAEAQILNVEKDRMDNDSTVDFHGNVEAHFTLFRQQSEVLEFEISNNLVYMTKLHNFMLIGDVGMLSARGEEFDGEELDESSFSTLERNGFLHLRANWMKTNPLSYETFTQVQFDDVRGMDLRYLAGGGLRWAPKTGKALTLALGTSVMYEHERWSYEDEHADGLHAAIDSTTNFMKSSSYISLHAKISDNFEANIVTYYQARFENYLQPRISGDIALNFHISEHFNFTSSFSYMYDYTPVVPIDKLIYNFSNGIQYEF